MRIHPSARAVHSRAVPRGLQPLSSARSLDPLVADLPACVSWQSSDPPRAVAAEWPGKFNNVHHEPFFTGTSSRPFPLHGLMLTLKRKLMTTERRDFLADRATPDHWDLPAPFPRRLKAWSRDRAKTEFRTRLAAIGLDGRA